MLLIRGDDLEEKSEDKPFFKKVGESFLVRIGKIVGIEYKKFKGKYKRVYKNSNGIRYIELSRGGAKFYFSTNKSDPKALIGDGEHFVKKYNPLTDLGFALCRRR